MTRSRPATQSDLLRFYGQLPPRSVRATVIESDGRVVGLAGYFVAAGRAVMFSDMNDKIPAITVWRESKKLMQSLTIPAICVGTEKSAPFLERLGWVFAGTSSEGMVFEWSIGLNE